LEEGWNVGQEFNPDTKWLFRVNYNFNRPVVVGQTAGEKDQIIIAAQLSVSEPFRQRFQSLPQIERHALIHDLRHDLILLGVGYAGIGHPLQQIQFSKLSYFDGLSKDLFLERVGKVRNAIILARGMIARALSEPLPDPSPESDPRSLGFQLPSSVL